MESGKFALATIILVILLFIPGTVVYRSIKFNQDCGGYLDQAANANTVELAIDRLNRAIDYLEKHNMTSGYTSVLWRTEDENVGFWYRNICACRDELVEVKDMSQLEKSNVLMKVRESLKESTGEHGDKVIIPPGISRFPDNLGFGIFRCIFWLYFVFYWAWVKNNY